MPPYVFPGPGPGRPKGTHHGRIRALLVLDKMLEEEGNLELLRQSLQTLFTKNPSRFFEKFIMPLLPAQTKLTLDTEGVIAWRSFLTTTHIPDSSPSTMPVIDVSEPSAVDGASARPCLPPPSLSTVVEARPPATTAGSPPPTSSPSEA